ncbi:MAG: hypothetical protein IJ899_09960 [Blautia sp.]|nr:hypothetical protein [Lachnospiraceae bacterium]MBR2257632.1 hypothetical protein [Blautia sp.]
MADQIKVVKVELNTKRVGELLKSKEVMAALKQDAKALGKVDSDWVGFDRCHVTIRKEQ